jgi:hypothetical protein
MDNMDYDGMGNQGRFVNDEDMKYRQGKSKKQVEDSQKILDVVIIITMVGYLGYALVSFVSNLIM